MGIVVRDLREGDIFEDEIREGSHGYVRWKTRES
jgi:hypothetical protein